MKTPRLFRQTCVIKLLFAGPSDLTHKGLMPIALPFPGKKVVGFAVLLVLACRLHAQVPAQGDVYLDARLPLDTKVVATRYTEGLPAVSKSARDALLEQLLLRVGEVVSKREIIEHVWDMAYDGPPNIVEVYVSALRRKLGAEVIETVRGAGYRLLAGV